MNDRLYELYQKKWEALSQKLNEIIFDNNLSQKPTNPLIVSLDEMLYVESDIKVLIFGQETNDWEKNFNGNLEHSLDTYDSFYNSGECYSYGGHFWNGYKNFLQSLSHRFTKERIAAVWNNVIKIGASGRDLNRPLPHIYDIELQYFNIIEDEIRILNPDIILFLSGPNYDNEIRNALPGIKFNKLVDEFSEREISKLTFRTYKNMYRTYHPNYLYRHGISQYFNAIIADIKL